MSSLAEVKTEIDRIVNPFCYSKTAKVLKTAAKFASKIVFKTDLTVDEDKEVKATASGSLDILSLFESNSDEVKGTRFIVFDDIERTFIPMEVLLGFINFFVERCKFHVLIIGDESKLKDENKKIYSSFKEKTIGRQFEIEPDVEAALDCYIEDCCLSKYIEKERQYIISCFKATTYNNLRLLRQCLYDFNEVLNDFSEAKIKENDVIFHGLLSSFIAVYAEYHNQKSHDTMVNWHTDFLDYNANLQLDDSSIICIIEKKYKEISEGNIYSATFYVFVCAIVEFLSKGCRLKETIEALCPSERINQSIQSKFENFVCLSNDEFNRRCDEVEQALLEGKIQDGNQLGTAIGYLGYFDAMQLRSINPDVLTSTKDFLDKRLSYVNEKNELLKFKNTFLYGYRYVSLSAENELPTNEIVQEFLEVIDNHQSLTCDDRQKILRKLSDENVGELIKLEEESYPDHSRSYSHIPVFEKEDPNLLFDEISKLSNKGRYEFRNFLVMHYKLGHKEDKLKESFEPDIKVLEVLLNMLREHSKLKECVEGLSYRNLIKTLDNVISKCKGDFF